MFQCVYTVIIECVSSSMCVRVCVPVSACVSTCMYSVYTTNNCFQLDLQLFKLFLLYIFLLEISTNCYPFLENIHFIFIGLLM